MKFGQIPISRRSLLFALSILALTAATAPSFTVRKIYFTTNTLESGTSVEPGFGFNYVWNGIGSGVDDRVYVAVCSNSEGQGGGDVCLVEYDPYADQVHSCGTVVNAYKAAGNWGQGEYCNKVHTWIHGTQSGKVWFGSENGGRGAHLLYLDGGRPSKVVDYSKTQKYIYTGSLTQPTLNHPAQPPSGTNGIAVQGYSFKTSNLNPRVPRYLWTESYSGYYFQWWDLAGDTTDSWPGGFVDLRVVLVDHHGDLYYSPGSASYKLTRDGQRKVVGSGVGNTPNASVYSHNFDSAYTVGRGEGVIVLYDFVNQKARRIADLPDGSNANQTYRAITVSGDGKSIYVLGDQGNIYEVSVASGQYANIGNVANSLAGSYAMSSGAMDTLGNWYIICWGSSTYLLQVNLGKDKVRALQFPAVTDNVERLALVPELSGLNIFPNPIASGARLVLPPGGGGWLSLYSLNGRLVQRMSFGPGAEESAFAFPWSGMPSGRYLLRFSARGRSWERPLVVGR